ncbi:hypothetical protein C8F04DRAFT_1181722 [Mycena alexandri]|uniref:Uncharacterized protein n=1 Tax=Mycena alexandri TaxID=1745969 RepID=A0AAD6SYV6_9AGAR|nr:hypothetical protein C8F04DRAFT_1181722 [Mycena alexandri]
MNGARRKGACSQTFRRRAEECLEGPRIRSDYRSDAGVRRVRRDASRDVLKNSWCKTDGRPECQRQLGVPGNVPKNGWRKADETERPKAAGGCSEGVTEVSEKRRSAPKSRTVVREKNGCVKESELSELPEDDAERPEVEFVSRLLIGIDVRCTGDGTELFTGPDPGFERFLHSMTNDKNLHDTVFGLASEHDAQQWRIPPGARSVNYSSESDPDPRSKRGTNSVCSDVRGLIRSERSFGAEHRSSENRSDDWLSSGEQSVQDHPRLRLLARCMTPERAPGSGSERSVGARGERGVGDLIERSQGDLPKTILSNSNHTDELHVEQGRTALSTRSSALSGVSNIRKVSPRSNDKGWMSLSLSERKARRLPADSGMGMWVSMLRMRGESAMGRVSTNTVGIPTGMAVKWNWDSGAGSRPGQIQEPKDRSDRWIPSQQERSEVGGSGIGGVRRLRDIAGVTAGDGKTEECCQEDQDRTEPETGGLDDTTRQVMRERTALVFGDRQRDEGSGPDQRCDGSDGSGLRIGVIGATERRSAERRSDGARDTENWGTGVALHNRET